MKRGDISIIENLIPGDRFYRLKDKQKTVLEWDKYQAKGKRVIAWTINSMNEKQKPIAILCTEQVVYLRNTSDQYAENIRKITDRPPEQKD